MTTNKKLIFNEPIRDVQTKLKDKGKHVQQCEARQAVSHINAKTEHVIHIYIYIYDIIFRRIKAKAKKEKCIYIYIHAHIPV